MNISRIRSILSSKSLNLYLFSSLFYLFYLLTIPEWVKFLVPCLNHQPGQLYNPNECSVTIALDRFMLLAVLGFFVLIIFLFFSVKPRSIKILFAVSVFFAISIVAAYHLYIPFMEGNIKSAPMLLYDPDKK